MNVSREEVAAMKRRLQDRQEERRAEADIDKAISMVNRHREARRQGAGQGSGSAEKVTVSQEIITLARRMKTIEDVTGVIVVAGWAVSMVMAWVSWRTGFGSPGIWLAASEVLMLLCLARVPMTSHGGCCNGQRVQEPCLHRQTGLCGLRRPRQVSGYPEHCSKAPETAPQRHMLLFRRCGQRYSDRCDRTNAEIFGLPPVKYVFFNTGLEMKATKDHVRATAEKYGVEIETVRPKVNIVAASRRYGIPFVSKIMSAGLSGWQKKGVPLAVADEYEQAEDKEAKRQELRERYPKCESTLNFLCCNSKESQGRISSW